MATLSEAELVDAIRDLEDLKCRAAALQVRLARELAAVRERDVSALVAYARRESPARGRQFVGLATALRELPHTEAAMDAGRLSEWRATIIARETACLSRDDRAEVDLLVARADSGGRYPFEGWGDRRLAAEVRGFVARLDPHAVVDRHARAEADRRVTLRPAPDTMAQLTALLPVAQGVAVWAILGRAADEARAAGDPRSRGQVMSDTLVERVTGQSRADAVPITVDLVVSDRALLAGGHEPAWLQGYGALTADHAVDLVQQAVADSRAALRRLYAAPAGGFVAIESRSRQFPAGLAHFLDLRDRTCRTPWCDAPIRHHDHVLDHALDGPTTELNGQGLCEQCNYVKQAPGWRSRPITGPPGAPHQVETTLPTATPSAARLPRRRRLRRWAPLIDSSGCCRRSCSPPRCLAPPERQCRSCAPPPTRSLAVRQRRPSCESRRAAQGSLLPASPHSGPVDPTGTSESIPRSFRRSRPDR